jgi:2-polyprenyl-6-methoxyphenol hydroxylase-like FAD-dependent oxidoreductase
MSDDSRRVLIAGGGPVGLLCAWRLGSRGIPVRLFDDNESLQADPRAATTHPATLDLLAEDGLDEDMARVGLVAPIFQFWDRPSDRLVAEFDHAVLSKDTRHPFVIQCEQFKTASLLLQRVQTLSNVEVLFNHEVIDVRQTDGSVSIDVRGPTSVQSHTGAYLIGADGGRSTVRKRSEIAFDGFTWPERFIVLTTPFDFEAQRGYSYRSYFAEPGAWCNCFKVSADGPPGLWRTVFPTEPSEDDAAIMSDHGVQDRVQRFFPEPRPYDIVHRNLYVTHQRVAATFRKGRVLLAGDAAHVNNPIGGMGLNGGIQDAVNLAGKLVGILLGGESDRSLDLYNLQRRTVATEFVQEQSIANKKRLEESDPRTRQKNLDELSRIAEDTERARQFLLRTAMILSQRRAESIVLNERLVSLP